MQTVSSGARWLPLSINTYSNIYMFMFMFILQGITSRLKETAVMLFLLGVLVNCVAWLLSSMLGGTQINQQNVYGKLSSCNFTPPITQLLRPRGIIFL